MDGDSKRTREHPLLGRFPALLAGVLALSAGTLGCQSGSHGYADPVEAERLRQADRLWSTYLAADEPASAEAYLEVAHALEESGAPDRARVVLRRGLERFPDRAELHEARAKILAGEGFRRAAERELEEALAIDPGRASAWLELGRVRLELDLPTAAASALHECERLGGGGPELDLLLARACRGTARREHALEHYDRALESPLGSDPENLLEAATLALEKGAERCDETRRSCLAWIARALELDPENARVHWARGRILERFGDLETAERCYLASLALDPSLLPALTALARLYADRGDEERTRGLVARALELEQNSSRRRALERLVD